MSEERGWIRFKNLTTKPSRVVKRVVLPTATGKGVKCKLNEVQVQPRASQPNKAGWASAPQNDAIAHANRCIVRQQEASKRFGRVSGTGSLPAAGEDGGVAHGTGRNGGTLTGGGLRHILHQPCVRRRRRGAEARGRAGAPGAAHFNWSTFDCIHMNARSCGQWLPSNQFTFVSCAVRHCKPTQPEPTCRTIGQKYWRRFDVPWAVAVGLPDSAVSATPRGARWAVMQ